MFFNLFNCSLQSYPTHKHNLTPPPPLSQSHSDYQPSLNSFTNIFIIRINCKNDLICLMMSCIVCLFPLQVIEKLDPEVLEFWIFSELAILGWYLTWCIKHARIPVCTYFYWVIHILCNIIIFL